MIENWNKIKHFKKSEFQCKCGCGLNNISFELVKKLDIARETANIPFHINSACRCETHNKKVGGSKNSSHLKGLAVDIRVRNSNERFIIKKSLYDIGVERFGDANSFLHCDIDDSKIQKVEWKY